jgi:hypothetical protein
MQGAVAVAPCARGRRWRHLGETRLPDPRGTYRIDGQLVIFTLITTAASRSLWAYVPATAKAAKTIEANPRFETEGDFSAFLDSCFTNREVVLAAAEGFAITIKSDGTFIPPSKNALILAATRWYLERSAALNAGLQEELAAASEATDTSEIVRTAQGALTGLPA